MFLLNALVVPFVNPFALMIFSRNVGKLFSELKLVTDNFLHQCVERVFHTSLHHLVVEPCPGIEVVCG